MKMAITIGARSEADKREKEFLLSWHDMYGAYQAGKSIAYTSRISGAPPSTVRYRVKHYSLAKDFKAFVLMRRVISHKNYNSVSSGKRRLHEYAFHADGESSCKNCELSKTMKSMPPRPGFGLSEEIRGEIAAVFREAFISHLVGAWLQLSEGYRLSGRRPIVDKWPDVIYGPDEWPDIIEND